VLPWILVPLKIGTVQTDFPSRYRNCLSTAIFWSPASSSGDYCWIRVPSCSTRALWASFCSGVSSTSSAGSPLGLGLGPLPGWRNLVGATILSSRLESRFANPLSYAYKRFIFYYYFYFFNIRGMHLRHNILVKTYISYLSQNWDIIYYLIYYYFTIVIFVQFFQFFRVSNFILENVKYLFFHIFFLFLFFQIYL
jgi:hypothetical protein